MQEKYCILNNSGQYFIITKCTEQQLQDYEVYGHKICLTRKGAIDLFKISNWLTNRKIKHTVIFGKERNLILQSMIKKNIDIILTSALSNNLLISNEELENVINMNADKRKDMFW